MDQDIDAQYRVYKSRTGQMSYDRFVEFMEYEATEEDARDIERALSKSVFSPIRNTDDAIIGAKLVKVRGRFELNDPWVICELMILTGRHEELFSGCRESENVNLETVS